MGMLGVDVEVEIFVSVSFPVSFTVLNTGQLFAVWSW